MGGEEERRFSRSCRDETGQARRASKLKRGQAPQRHGGIALGMGRGGMVAISVRLCAAHYVSPLLRLEWLRGRRGRLAHDREDSLYRRCFLVSVARDQDFEYRV